jgi:hypothetical protein
LKYCYTYLQVINPEQNYNLLVLTARGLSPMTPFVDAPDKFQWKWINLDSMKNMTGIMTEER